MQHTDISFLWESEINAHIQRIAQLRIDIFRKYPYLYDGNLDYEADYLKKFADTPDSLIVILQDQEKIVGAMTGLPMTHEEENIQAPWLERDINIEHVYYFSEILLYPEYRGKGLGKRVFSAAEAKIKELNKYRCFSLATVIREKDHPQRPASYNDLDGFWEKHGYHKESDMICYIPWKEPDEADETDKPLVFWLKEV